MKIKIFAADSTAEAMALVREEFGIGAVIMKISEKESDGKVRITAGLDGPKQKDPDALPEVDVLPLSKDKKTPVSFNKVKQIFDAFQFHGVPQFIQDKILSHAPELVNRKIEDYLADIMHPTVGFAPVINFDGKEPLILVGEPGVGKTVTIAKLALQGLLEDKKVYVFTIDTVKSGALEQLEHLLKPMKIEPQVVSNMGHLQQIKKLSQEGSLVLLDTPGINPFAEDEMQTIEELIRIVSAPPVIVCSAGGEAHNTLDSVKAFTNIGADRLLITKMDLAYRYGAIVAAGSLAKITASSSNPKVSVPVQRLNACDLAKILLNNVKSAQEDWQGSIKTAV